MSFAAIAVGVGTAASVGMGAAQMAGSSGAANQSRRERNAAIGQAYPILSQSNQTTSRYLNPYASNGTNYLSAINDELLGGDLGKQYSWQEYARTSGLPTNATQQDYLKPYTAADFGKEIGDKSFTLSDLYRSMTPGNFKATYGYDIKGALQPFTGEDLADTPGYQFRLDQGLQALDRSAAARGGVLGGGQVKAAQRYAQDYAGNEFENAYERDLASKSLALGQYNTAFDQNQADLTRKTGLFANQQQYQTQVNQNQLANYYQSWQQKLQGQLQRYGMLAGMAGMGQDAATTAAGMKQNNAHQLVNTLTGGATAGGQNAWNQASANSSALGGIANNLSGLAGMYMLYNRPGTGTGTSLGRPGSVG